MRLQDKTALVTASGQGIGRATVERFLAEGATVIATDIDTSLLADLEDAQVYRLDVTQRADIAELARELGGLDILFNCAGMVPGGSILECNDATWEHSYALNVTAMFHMIQAFLPGMLNRGGGSIINMASLASSIKGIPNRFAYGTTKAAVIGLTKSVAADFMTQGIRCNAICPGTVESPSLHQRIEAQAQQQERDHSAVFQDFIDRQPMGRLGRPEEIAALATFLASDEAAFITGTTQLIDGGWAN
ncbi:SDR family oxidoreductase [Halomonas elongata]|uniref:Probable oxidoreductase (Short-chain dehydrogenase family) n=1 Tax=Halomonas elongata (strain ATCC 33173 / DSM 2581 / NBRC 15536 / NCIMB 2198 / 1H9) TaxID=768066 RepID=E1V7J7_HALED|nr:SDR family oxidoreductase [Halomonas elongata]RAW09006.1 SDR family NAD(P)-dependent oxidoreductase [Halomonas elongata]WBF20027.1 SDR family oxidoreductase [Halomonas elongata]WPU49200.1 SDR family oxidoreductase [Halomonas elongata DSM 2581]CBV43435.2 probable oxidoreductase (short-chain dehydrogenase family) [Halomonas elongata DSM 2581]